MGFMAALPSLLSMGGSILGMAQGNANSGASADASERNALIARQNATTALQAGSTNEEAQRRKSAVELGRQRASLAESGIGLESGTAGDLTSQSAMNAEMDALNIRYGAAQQARGYTMQADQEENNAAAARASSMSAILKHGFKESAKFGVNVLTGTGKYSGVPRTLSALKGGG